jgi:pimeloyl-ACP methyl ester carboxylesterase
VVKGETTDSFSDERAARAMDRLSQGRLLVVPGSTHFVPMEFPRVIADLIVEELDDSAA